MPSDAFLAALTQSRTQTSRIRLLEYVDGAYQDVDAWQNDTAYHLGGSFTESTEREVRRNASVTVANHYGLWTPGDPGDPLWALRPFAIDLGILLTVGWEWQPQGIYLVTDARMTGREAATVSIQAVDRTALIALSKVRSPITYPEGTTVAAILLDQAIAGGLGTTLYRLGPAEAYSVVEDYTLDQDALRWREMRTLARDFGLDLYFDDDGYLTASALATTTSLGDATVRYVEGEDATFMDTTRGITSDDLYNATLVIGESSGRKSVWASARDLNPASPSYNPPPGHPDYPGPIGDRVYTYRSATIADTDRARAVANALLVQKGTVQQTVDVTAVPDPTVRAGSVATIRHSDTGTDGTFLLRTIQMPLAVDSDMTVETSDLTSLTADFAEAT